MAKKQIFKYDIDLNQNQAQNIVIDKQSSDPASGAEGQVIYNSTDKVLKYHNGTSFAPVGGGISEVNNGAITPASGVASWEFDNPAGSTKALVRVFEVSSNDEVQMCVNVTASKIKVEWNESAASVAADTYRAVVSY